MACKPCAEKAKAKQNPTFESSSPDPHTRLSINCPCGLQRLIPAGLNLDDRFTLVPCPRCGASFRGVFKGDGVVQI